MILLKKKKRKIFMMNFDITYTKQQKMEQLNLNILFYILMMMKI